MTRGFPTLLGLVLAACLAALSFETDGFRVVSSAGARQLAIERSPRPLPNPQLVDQDGHVFSLAGYRGRRLMVDFIYTRCPTICGLLGDDFENVARMVDNGAAAGIDLLSISFDPANDDREALRLYGERFGAHAPHWRIARPANAEGLAALLQSFGVVVIPDGAGGFIHNSAVYVVDGQGRLVRILDPDAPGQLVTAALQAVAP